MSRISHYEVPYFDTFPNYANYLIRTHGDKTAIAQYDRRGNLSERSYRDLGEDSLGLARVLRAECLAGAHIAVVGENSCDWLTAFLGIVCAGAVAVTIDIEQPDETIRAMLQRSDATVAFASPTFLPICRPLLDSGCLTHLFPMDTGEEGSLRDLCRRGREMTTPLGDNLNAESDASIVFTSGTTSAAKPVLLSQRNILVNATEGMMLARGTQALFAPLPLYHTYGLNSTVLGTMIHGVRITLSGDLKTMLRDMKLSGAGTIAAVPLMVETIYKGLWKGVADAGKTEELTKLLAVNRVLRRFGLSWRKKDLLRVKAAGGLEKLDQCVVGGAHISRELSEDLGLLGITVLQGYGITECSPLVSVNSMESCEMGSVGHLVPSCRVKFEDGEILVKGPAVMRGYYRAPELTAAAFDPDGWFRTGDLGYMDRRGFLYITGRKKNLIVCKNGNKISPEMLEALLTPLPLVKEVLVSGIAGGGPADDVKVAASICPDPAATAGMSSYEILERLQKDVDAINRQLPTYQQIQMINIRDTEFEKTATKKIRRSPI